jgi:hypothetical protein
MSNKEYKIDDNHSRKCAMEWWINLKPNLDGEFSKFKLGYAYFNKHWMSLTGREIEIIYKSVHLKKDNEKLDAPVIGGYIWLVCDCNNSVM